MMKNGCFGFVKYEAIWDDASYQLGDAVAGAPQKGESRMAESGLGCSTVQCISVTWVFFFFFPFSSRGSSTLLVHDEACYQNPCTTALLLQL